MSRGRRHLSRNQAQQKGGGDAQGSDTAAAERRDQLLLQAVIAHRDGRIDQAERLGQMVLAEEPRYPPALQLLGMIAGKTGRTALGINLLREAIVRQPESVDCRIELAMLLRNDGQAQEAIAQCREAIRLKPDNAAAHNNLGLSYLAERHIPDAITSFEQAIALKPELAILHQNLAIALQLQSRDAEAISCYQRAISLAPNDADSHVRLGHLLRIQGRRDDATACFERATKLRPESTEGLARLARVLTEVGQLAPAAECLRQSIARDPGACEVHEQLGSVLQQLGRFDEAAASFRRAIALQPSRTAAYLNLALTRKFAAEDRPLLQQMHALLEKADLADPDRANLHYGLGKALDDLDDCGAAMLHFDAANRIAMRRLRRAGRALDRQRHANTIERLMVSSTAESFERSAWLGSDCELPIFIVGMIRSGTTLIEQIVASHPEVGAGGELRFWGDRAGAAVGEAAAGVLDATTAGRLAEDYCRLLRGIAPGARRVTDKMPTNFLLLGLIHLLLPQARIIHCRRNPIDTCLSIYMTPYPRSPDYAHERRNIVFYYQQYLRLMAHWRRVLPVNRLLEIDYEDLVADHDRVTRRMIAFCGLDWHDACLHHESNERVIKTPSVWQARQPVYQTSVNRWRRYLPWLGDFRRLRQEPGADGAADLQAD